MDSTNHDQVSESKLEGVGDRVLLVDDNPINLQVLTKSLTGLGLTLLIARSGEEALKIASEAPPALILLDINMPGIGGFETCRRLKADPLTAEAIVVFLSASNDSEDKVKGFELGAADYISKPFNLNEVLARVRSQLDSHRRYRELCEKNDELATRSVSSFNNIDSRQLHAMIRAGESDRFELKSTLRWNIKAKRHGKEIENAWLKTVVAFLNSNGGVLVIGVGDDGTVLGLENDDFSDNDRFLLHANNLIRTTIGPDFAPFIDFAIKEVEETDVFVVACQPSPRPAFLKRDNDEDFYIRLGPGSRKLLPSEILAYVQSRESTKVIVDYRPAPAVESPPATPGERILLVDDNTDNLQVLIKTLDGHGHELLIARSGEEALAIAATAQPSLILLDIMMPPGIDGFETCRRLKSDAVTRDQPVIFMSALSETSEKVRGFDLGAVDYITKPFQAEEVLARVETHLKIHRLQNKLSSSIEELHLLNSSLEDKIQVRTVELMNSRDAVIFGLAKLTESRDDDTGQHLERICRYVEILATEIASHNVDLDEQWVHTLSMTAALHDIGKVGIPDSVLLKPGKLTDDERETIRRHTTIGGDTLLALKQHWDDDSFLTTAIEIVFAHHERWDGDGYPFGLVGDTIPLPARICSVADVYDALRSPRVYKPAMSHIEARDIIVDGSGSQFDPAIVAAFLKVESEFERISIELMPNSGEPR